MVRTVTQQTCPQGHRYTKSSDSLTCPICEAARANMSGFPRAIGTPATRALQGAGFTQLRDLTTVSEAQLLALHGLGPRALRILREALDAQGLSFATP